MATGHDRLTPEDEAESALELSKQGLRTLASGCSTMKSGWRLWTHVVPLHIILFKGK